MEVDSEVYDSDPDSTLSSSDSEAEPSTDPWVTTRTLALRCAMAAKENTINKRTGKPSSHWPKVAGARLMEILESEKYKHAPKPANPAEFCSRWFSRFNVRQSVKDAPRSGRKPKVPEVVLSMLVQLVVETSPKRQADMMKHPAFTEVVTTYKVNHKTVWRHMRQLQPRLRKCVKYEFKRPLKPEHIQARVRVTSEWLQEATLPSCEAASDAAGPGPSSTSPSIPRTVSDLNVQWIRRIIWIDAKKFYVQPHDFKAWGLLGTPSNVLQDPRLKGKPWVIHYYSAVNYAYGALVLQLVSGTRGTGYKPVRTYKVGYDGV